MPLDTQHTSLNLELGAQPMAFAPARENTLPNLPYAAFGKRMFDIAAVLLSLPFVLPVIALMALVVALDGHGPFYTQERVGRNGRRFRMLKIRTMVHNADALLEKCLQKDDALRAEWTTTQKLKNDMRITRVGRILRKTSLDELPQLLNVLFGSMSLVGPRPMMTSQETLYPGRSYYRLRPGITGFWQISDRNNCDFRDRSKYDAVYERELSLKTDLGVLWRTVSVVFRGTGY